MSAYLKFFELEQSPFEGKAQSQVVLGTRALRDAFGTIRSGLEESASRICVSGSAGLGKTSLARALPKLLGDEARVAHVHDAGVRWADCRDGIARQWGLGAGRLSRAALVEARADRRLVIVIDQAERADDDFLDHLDVLLSYRTEEDTPVVQSVLLANLTTPEGETPVPLLWWLDRIQTLQLEFAPLPRDGVASYITKHLRRAGWRGEALFSEAAGFAIHGHAGGVPGEISALCEKLLVEAASRGRTAIDAEFVHAICDPEPVEEEAGSEASALAEDDSEGAWTVPDEFEALMAEGEFSGAENPVRDADPAESLDAAEDAGRIASPKEAAQTTADAAGADETAVLRVDDAAADEDDHAESPLVFPSEPEPDAPTAPSEAADAATAPIPLADEAHREPTESPRSLAAALDFFESATEAVKADVPKAAGDAPIELDDVVEESGDDETAGAAEDGARSTFATDEAMPEAAVVAHGEHGTDAACVPEPDPLERLDAPLTDDEIVALKRLATARERKPFVVAAIAALVAGGVFVFFGGADPATPGPSARVAQEAPPTPTLATPGRGFVGREVIERLPKDTLAEAVAAAEALAPMADTRQAQVTRPSAPPPVRSAAPMRRTREAGPEAARPGRTRPSVTDEAGAKNDPTLGRNVDEAQAPWPASPGSLAPSSAVERIR